MSEPAAADAILSVRGVSKRYPGVLALDGVDFTLAPGEVHVLFGENGAGKSTLISILAGANTPTEGEILFRGKPVRFSSVHDARERGISAVFQEFSLVPQMTVAENLFLGAERTSGGFLASSAMRREAAAIIERLGFPLRAGDRVDRLTRAEQQMVEIAKAFRSDLSVLILDEPTASLTDRETDQLFDLVAKIRAEGVGVVYITHRMQEIRRIADRITVLRDGRHIATVTAGAKSDDELIELMTGRTVEALFPAIRSTPGEVRLSVERLTTASGSVDGASFEVRAGEIVGLAGLVGSGKSEVMRAVYGLEPPDGGRVTLGGEDVTGVSPAAMLKRGLFYVPPDRRNEGLAMIRPVRENLTMAALDGPPLARGPWLAKRAERDVARSLAERMELRPPRIERAVDTFSGGNQQKVLLGKCLTREVSVFVFDEPTVGVDVGTRAAIYRFIADLAEAGAAIVLVSSDLPEILHLTHRAIVFYRGRVAGTFTGPAITEANLLGAFFEREAA
jgi:ribose transport system ATP-binding protein